jgi:hypothetical protein
MGSSPSDPVRVELPLPEAIDVVGVASSEDAPTIDMAVAHAGDAVIAGRVGRKVPAGLAASVRDLARASYGAAEGIRNASDPLRVVLSPTTATKNGLRDGSLALTKRSGGGFLPQARSVKTGHIVENIAIKPAAPTAAKGARVAAGGAVIAWQAAAFVTQQHFLTEVSDRLGGIASDVRALAGIGEARDDGDLSAITGDLDLLAHLLSNGTQLTARDRENAETLYRDATAIWRARFVIAQAAAETALADPTVAAQKLLLADEALAVVARCAWTVLQLPTDDEQRLIGLQDHYAEKLGDAAAQTDAVADRLAAAATEIREEWRLHNEARANLKANMGQGRSPTRIVAATPAIGAAYVGIRRTVRDKTRRSEKELTPATFSPVDRGRLRAPRLPKPEEAPLDWIEERATSNDSALGTEFLVTADGDVFVLEDPSAAADPRATSLAASVAAISG